MSNLLLCPPRFTVLFVFWCLLSGISPSVYAQGIYWQQAVHYDNTMLLGIDCADSLDCMMSAMVGAGSVATIIYHSTDGGISWKTSFKDTPVIKPIPRRPLMLLGVQHRTRMHAVVGADSGVIYRTSDGGESWQRVQVAGANNRCEHLSMVDDRNGIACFNGPGVPVVVTEDGGITWKKVTVPRPDNVEWDSLSRYTYNVMCIAPRTYLCIVIGPRTHGISRSTDGGKTWYLTYPIFGDKYDSLQLTFAYFSFLSPLDGFIAIRAANLIPSGARSILAHTTDGGVSWNVVFDGNIGDTLKEIPLLITFRDGDHGVAGGFYNIHSTSDGGKTWQQDSCNSYPPSISGISFDGGHRGIAISQYGGNVFLRTELLQLSAPLSGRSNTTESVCATFSDGCLRIRHEGEWPSAITVSLYDMLGRKILAPIGVLPGTHPGELLIPVPPVRPGHYLLRILDGSAQWGYDGIVDVAG